MPPSPTPLHHSDTWTSPGKGASGAGSLTASAERERSTESEFFSPIPEGYVKGRHKYVVVLGTVMSGLGKGIFSSSLAKLLQDKSLTVAPIKLEGYLNIDAGTLNPYRHGEVFVLDDGTECDMDLGTYERLLDQNMARSNFTTSGQVFSTILERERRGAYLGRDVQMIPHVTGEVKRRLREVALRGDGHKPADVVFVEVGGTVGDYENGFYIEALRELAFEEGPESCCFVALTYVIEPNTLGEQKSKGAQLGIKRLMEAGIQPHVISCRASRRVERSVAEKIAMFSNVPMHRLFSMHDRKSIYSIPEEMRAEGLDREILSILNLHHKVDQSAEDVARNRWSTYVRKLEAPRRRAITVGLSGKYVKVQDAYASIAKCLEHCTAYYSCDIHTRWIDTTDLTKDTVAGAFEGVDAVIVPGGFGARGVEGKVECVRHCRETGLPYLGICLGMQVAVIEFARNVVGIENAGSTEFLPAGSENAVISELPEQKEIEGLGGTMRLGAQDVLLEPGSLASRLYSGATQIRERFRHRYEVDPSFVDQLTDAGAVFSGRHPTVPIMQMVELPQTGPHAHPFFIAGQFHPELTGRPLRPQPLFMGLVGQAIVRKMGDAEIEVLRAEGIDVDRWTAPASGSGTSAAAQRSGV